MAAAGEAATEVTHDMQLKLNHILDESNLLHTKLAELTTGNYLTVGCALNPTERY